MKQRRLEWSKARAELPPVDRYQLGKLTIPLPEDNKGLVIPKSCHENGKQGLWVSAESMLDQFVPSCSGNTQLDSNADNRDSRLMSVVKRSIFLLDSQSFHKTGLNMH